MDAVLWALSYSMQPHRDTEVIRGKVPRLDPSIAPSDDARQFAYPDGAGASSILINACREHPYLPVSLPREDFMQAALARWRALGLPPLDLRAPWHGYPLDGWTAENAEEAELAVTGRYFETGEKLAGRRGGPRRRLTGQLSTVYPPTYPKLFIIQPLIHREIPRKNFRTDFSFVTGFAEGLPYRGGNGPSGPRATRARKG